MANLRSSSPLFLSFLSFFLLSIVAQAQVPAAQQFRWVNQGPMADYVTEFGAWYRQPSVAGFSKFPFRLCFYNTTPDAHVFAIRMGSRRGENIMRWVWDANRNSPARENSTLTFGRDGNLVLANADGRVVWQTNTANKGVTGFQLLPTGNLVLQDRTGRFVWQSFDHPTDTLLVGQSLRLAGVNKLVSRTSDENGSDGPYSAAISPKGFLTHFTSAGVALPYGGWLRNYQIDAVTLAIEPDVVEGQTVAYFLSLTFQSNVSNSDTFELVRIYYNSTFSFLRISSDGNLRTFTYNDKVVEGAWLPTFSFFAGDFDTFPFYSFGYDRRCGLPGKCGSFGLCQEGMCVACPQPRGMLGWSQSCAPPKLSSSCKAGAANYYKIDGVEHFVSRTLEGEGPMKETECREKCSKDCKCVGFFYWRETSRCWLAPVLGTLRKVEESSHVGYVKVSQ
ncbi:hypothetical protein ACLOJK_008807 [Asimina triloba]